MRLVDELRSVLGGAGALLEAIDRGATFYSYSDKPKPRILNLRGTQVWRREGAKYTGAMFGIPAHTEVEWTRSGVSSMRDDQEYVFSFKLRPGLKILDLGSTDDAALIDLLVLMHKKAGSDASLATREYWAESVAKKKDRREKLNLLWTELTSSYGSSLGSLGLRELGYDAIFDDDEVRSLPSTVVLLRPDVMQDVTVVGGLATAEHEAPPNKRTTGVPEYVIDALVKYNTTAGKALSKDAYDFLEKHFKPDKALVLYRGMGWDSASIGQASKVFKEQPEVGNKVAYKTPRIQSWTTNRDVAIDFTGRQTIAGKSADSFGVIVRAKIDPKDVIADLRLLPSEAEKQLRFRSQREVLVKPGTIQVTVVKVDGAWAQVFDPGFAKTFVKTIDDLLSTAGKAHGLKLAKAFGDYMYSKHLVNPGKKFTRMGVEVIDDSMTSAPGYRVTLSWVKGKKPAGMGLTFGKAEVKVGTKEELMKYVKGELATLIAQHAQEAATFVVGEDVFDNEGSRLLMVELRGLIEGRT